MNVGNNIKRKNKELSEKGFYLLSYNNLIFKILMMML